MGLDEAIVLLREGRLKGGHRFDSVSVEENTIPTTHQIQLERIHTYRDEHVDVLPPELVLLPISEQIVGALVGDLPVQRETQSGSGCVDWA